MATTRFVPDGWMDRQCDFKCLQKFLPGHKNIELAFINIAPGMFVLLEHVIVAVNIFKCGNCILLELGMAENKVLQYTLFFKYHSMYHSIPQLPFYI